jgi:hypothetical protein
MINEDPLLKGRCRVKVFGKFDLIPDESIPWATPMNRDAVGSHHVPRVGDIVSVRFDNGDIYHPEYWFQVDQNQDLKSDVLEASDAPHDVISLVYDAERNLRIYHSPEDGLVITRGQGAKERPMLQIDEEGFIKISTDAKMFLDSGDIFVSNTGEGGADETEPAVRGQSLQDWLQKLLDDYNTHIHPTGVGPSGPPQPPTPVTVAELSATHINYQQKDK